jgi:ribosomal protein S18 acetylase RimI-like enzyme
MAANRGCIELVDVFLTPQPHDPESLYQIFRSAMEPYVDAARGEPWNDERERAQFFLQLALASVQLIVVEHQVIGFIDLRAFDDHCVVHTMVVAPQWQSGGIGSTVLEQLKTKWTRISLSVLKTNPRARQFYERAGFHEVGSTEHHYQMAWASNTTGGRLAPAPAYRAVLKTTLVAVALVLAYCLIQVYVGHGEAPAALILAALKLPYLPVAVVGWLGVCALAAAVWLARRRAGSAMLAGSVGLLLLHWVGLLWVTANRELTLLWSIPFLVVAAWVLFRRGRVGS